MLKKFIPMALCSILMLQSGLVVTEVDAATGTSGKIAYESMQKMQVNGKQVTVQMYALKDSKGNSTNYVKLRDVAYLLNGTDAQFNVVWDGEVNILPKQAYVASGKELQPSYSGNRAYQEVPNTTYIKGQLSDLEAISIKNNDGNSYTYYKLRDLGKALGFYVGWDSAEKMIDVRSGKLEEATEKQMTPEERMKLAERNRPYQAMKDFILELTEEMPVSSKKSRTLKREELIYVDLVQVHNNGEKGLFVQASNEYRKPDFPKVYVWRNGRLIQHPGSEKAMYVAGVGNVAYSEFVDGTFVVKSYWNSSELLMGKNIDQDEIAQTVVHFSSNKTKCMEAHGYDPDSFLSELLHLDVIDADTGECVNVSTSKLDYYEFEEEYGYYSDLKWKTLITCNENDIDTSEDDTYTIHVNSQKSVEDTLAELDRLMEAPLTTN